MAEVQNEIVYVLTNPAMLGLVKIGRTTQKDIGDRLRQLYTTGVPLPFECVYACRVSDCAKVEAAFHFAFGKSRINESREFFQIEPERVIAVLKLLAISDATPEVESVLLENVTPEEKSASIKIKASRRPSMNFVQMGIPIGERLVFKDGITFATVVGEKKVEYKGDTCSLTAATRDALGVDFDVQPSPHWFYNGKMLKEIYENTYSSEENEI